jgi:hypothetical protein
VRALNPALGEVNNTGGNLGNLWKLKSLAGAWAQNAWVKTDVPATVKHGYRTLNQRLDKFLTSETARIAADSTDPVLQQSLGALNARYSALKTVEPLLGDQVGKLAAARSYLGFGAGDLPAGGAVAAVAAGVGVPAPLASALGLAGAAANQWARSTPGRIARANIGMALEQKAQAASVAAGAVPRTVKGFKDWATKNFQALPPQVQQPINAIMGAPDDRAEQMIRAILPQFAQYFAKAKYPSEFEGKVSAQDDKDAIRRELEKLAMPAREKAIRLSAMHKDGTIAPEVFDPQAYLEQMNEMAGVAQKFGVGM